MIATRTPASSPHGTPGLSLLPAAVRARLYNEPFSRRSCLSVFDGCGMEHRVPLCCSPPHTLPHVHIQTYNSTRRRGGFFALRSQIMHHDWIMIVTIVTPSLTPPPPPPWPGPSRIHTVPLTIIAGAYHPQLVFAPPPGISGIFLSYLPSLVHREGFSSYTAGLRPLFFPPVRAAQSGCMRRCCNHAYHPACTSMTMHAPHCGRCDAVIDERRH